MTVSSVTGTGSTGATTTSQANGMATLGQADFLKLLTTQLSQQDPTDPVDNKEMIAQMAQFSSLAGMTEMGDTLKEISTKLDVILGGQTSDASTDETSTDGTNANDIPSQE